MKNSHFRERFRELVKDPSALLAYFTLRRSMKESGLPVSLDDGFIILIVPVGFRGQHYKSAAYVLLNSETEEWGDPRTKVRLASAPKRKESVETRTSIFDLLGLKILIATHIGEVPKDVRFVASRIMSLQAPTTQDVNTTRRVLGLPKLATEHVSALIGKPENVMLAGILKREWSADDVRILNDLERQDIEGPNLFELPGYEELKDWARGIARDVDRWREGTLDWKAVTPGAVVAGAPGVGKTYLAGALATALGFRLITTTVGSWQSSGHLNDMLRAMRLSFEEARNARGALLFIDELDSIGTRPARPTGDRNEIYWQVVISEFLSLMNDPGPGVLVIGATNYIEWIDPAILRAGRIEKHFALTLPDTRARAEILRFHIGGNISLESLVEIANELNGKSAAALEELARAARKKARDEDRELDLCDLRAQLPKKRKYTPEQLFRLGVHEAGHALISLALNYATAATIELNESFDPAAISYAGAQTSYELVEDNLPTDTTLLNRIAVGVAGMAAEATVFTDRSLGSGGLVGSDVERATAIARRLVGSYGLGTTPVFVASVDELGDKTLPVALENEVMKILRNQYLRVRRILTSQKDQLIALAGEAAAHGQVMIEIDGQSSTARKVP